MYFSSGRDIKNPLTPQDIRKGYNFFIPNAVTAGGLSTAEMTADRYVWYPLIVGNHDLYVTLIGLVIQTEASAGKKGRAAIYSDSGDRDFEPNDLLYDCGEFDIDQTGFAGVDVSIKLQRRTLYWVAFALEEAVRALYKPVTTLISICIPVTSLNSPCTAWRAVRSFAEGFPSNARNLASPVAQDGFLFVGVL